MFEITEESFGKFKQYILRNTSTNEYLAVIPAFGATINQIVLKKNNTLHELIDGCSSYEELITEGKNKFKGSKLFPFPNRTKDGCYTFEGNTYQLPVNFPNENNAIHGLTYDANFNVLKKETSTDSALLSIEFTTTGDEKGYPFKVKITINYLLDENGFTCTTYIQNIDTKTIPFGDGWHPYYKTGSKIDDCYLSLPVSHSFQVDERMVPTGKIVEENKFNVPKKIGNTYFDTCYKVKPPPCPLLKKGEGVIATTIIEDKSKNIKIVILQEAGENHYNYIQVYIPPRRNSIAIEPMTCLTNAFNNKEGLILLKLNEIKSFIFGIRLS